MLLHTYSNLLWDSSQFTGLIKKKNQPRYPHNTGTPTKYFSFKMKKCLQKI